MKLKLYVGGVDWQVPAENAATLINALNAALQAAAAERFQYGKALPFTPLVLQMNVTCGE